MLTTTLAGCLGGNEEFDTSELDQQITDLQQNQDEMNQTIAEQTQANAELQQTFRGLVRGYPTVLIFDIERELKEDGSKSQDKIKIHGQRMGYMPDPNSFINTAEANLKNRE